MNDQYKQTPPNKLAPSPKPGKKYIRAGKIVGFFALITIPASPLYMQLFLDDSGWGLELIFIPIYIAILLAIASIVLFIIGWQYNKNLQP